MAKTVGWKRGSLKKSARASMRTSYLRMVMVCMLMAMFAGTPGVTTVLNGAAELQSVNFKLASNTEIVNSMISSMVEDNRFIWNNVSQLSSASRGIMAGLFNNVTRSGNMLFGILNAINQLFFQDRVGAGIIIFIGVLAMLAYRILIGNPLAVGEVRFFLEAREYDDAKVGRLLYLLRIRKTRAAAWVMLCRDLMLIAWSLTIIGGPIKWYAYRMVPCILAENPGIARRDAFRLSQAMMKGQKWRTFLLDCSFIGWYLLSLISMGIFGVLFLYPYKNATDAELYITLRHALLARHPGTRRYFNDLYLVRPAGDSTKGEYPLALYPIQEHPSRGWLNADHHRRYSLQHLVLMFFTFAVAGWVWEVFVDLMNKGVFVNRGTLYGPWVPIYGVGGVLVLVVLNRFADRPLLTFGLAFLLCGVMEYATSWALEMITGKHWWDYSGYFMNINGRVCLEGLLVFAIAGCLAIYQIGPMLDELYKKIPRRAKNLLCLVLVSLFVIDVAYSAMNPNTAAVEPEQS